MTVVEVMSGGVLLSASDTGAGFPVIFQHGLGGDEAQVAEVFPAARGLRRLTLECRGHGRSQAGPYSELSIKTFAADVLAFADARGLRKFAIGGISMGAAIALRIAVTGPQRVMALVLSRPAWLWDAAPDNMRPFVEVASALQEWEPQEALRRFDGSETARMLAEQAPDNLASLRGFFTRDNPVVTSELLGRIAMDGPGVTKAEISALNVPALVIGNRLDAVHPLDYAERLAGLIPGAQFIEVAPKAEDRARHGAEVRTILADFLSACAKANGSEQ